jgi:hypothetical protein
VFPRTFSHFHAGFHAGGKFPARQRGNLSWAGAATCIKFRPPSGERNGRIVPVAQALLRAAVARYHHLSLTMVWGILIL